MKTQQSPKTDVHFVVSNLEIIYKLINIKFFL